MLRLFPGGGRSRGEQGDRMHIFERMHVLHRVWRYRLRSEREEIAFLLSRDLRGGTLVDIGANRGIYSYWMHRLAGPQGHVVAFEPQPELVDYLHDLKTAFGLRRLSIVDVGLSSCPGRRELSRPVQHWGAATLEPHHHEDVERLAVDVMTLDDYFLESPLRPLRFIKCDVEGHEAEVFLGGRRVLSEDRPDLLFEGHDCKLRDGALFSWLDELGYDGFFFVNGRLVPVTQYALLRSTIPKRYLNYVFLAKN
jgi:FkbM family methyltransferase